MTSSLRGLMDQVLAYRMEGPEFNSRDGQSFFLTLSENSMIHRKFLGSQNEVLVKKKISYLLSPSSPLYRLSQCLLCVDLRSAQKDLIFSWNYALNTV